MEPPGGARFIYRSPSRLSTRFAACFPNLFPETGKPIWQKPASAGQEKSQKSAVNRLSNSTDNLDKPGYASYLRRTLALGGVEC